MGWYAGPKASHLCSHAKFNLKGCNLLSGHEGPHNNIFDTTNETWEDKDGKFCETREDWISLVNNLENRKGNY